jgi:hypothetical protein
MLSYNIVISAIKRIWGKNTDTQNETHRKSTILYAAGCGFVMVMLFGEAVSGVVADHFSNYSISSLYYAGSRFFTAIYYGGTVLGVVFNYFWNYLILCLALRWQKISITRKRRLVYTAIITAVGLLIDTLYYDFTWGTLVIGSLRIPPIFEKPRLNPGLELSTILIPMALIGAVNYFASRLYLHLDKKQALVVGLAMAVFTAPWVMVAVVLLVR